jgi:CBS domain containing-hemolysin-like protein
MSATTLAVAFVLLMLSMLSGTANLSLRQLSRHRLTELLEARGKTPWIEQINRNLHLMILTTSAVRHTCHIAFTLAVAAAFHEPLSHNAVAYYAAVALTAAILILVFGVAIPNSWARHVGERFIATMYPLLRASHLVLSPAIWFLNLFDDLVRRLAGVPAADPATQAEVIEQEILDVVSEGEAHGAVDEQEKEMIESVIEFRDTQVGQIMTPRTQFVSIENTASLDEAKKLINKEGHSRVPVYEGTIDNIQGVLYAKDLLKIQDTGDVKVADIMRTVPFIPETKTLRSLLHQFLETKVHMAIILDEYGGTAGLVTFEDLIEELIGEITDEYEEPEPEPIVRLDTERVEVDAGVRINELNDELDIELPENDDYDTVGGFVFSTLGRIPRPGEQFEHANLHIEILDAEERRIKRLRLRVMQRETEPS